jgi:hypothetical protein
MPAAKVTCPACHAVLRPTKPLRPGKKVKCPKCSETFTVPDAEEEGMVVLPAAPPPAKKSTPGFDDEGPATYGVVQEEVNKEEEEEDDDDEYDDEDEDDEDRPRRSRRRGPHIDLIPDMRIKDLRGPAQEQVIGPSNRMMYAAIIACLTNLALALYFLIPIIFPNLPEEDSARGNVPVKKKEEVEKEKKQKEADTWGLRTGVFVAVVVVVYGFGMIYNAIITVGAIKMQTLESYSWGMTSSIMSMVPLPMAVPIILVLLLMHDFPDVLELVFYGGNFVTLFLTGLWSLITLRKKVVVDGFNYVAD